MPILPFHIIVEGGQPSGKNGSCHPRFLRKFVCAWKRTHIFRLKSTCQFPQLDRVVWCSVAWRWRHSLDLISALSLWHWSTDNNLWTHCVFLESSIIPHTCVSISASVRRFTPVPIPPAWPCRVMQSINHCSHHLTGVVWCVKGNNCPWYE